MAATTGKRHTIVLMQFDEAKESRSYIDYEGVPEALDGICQLYEQSLKVMNPKLKSITYDISDLFGYIDGLGDLCCLVFNPQSNSYIPHNKEWIKARVFDHLKGQVQQ
mmetsp:Transcript_84351/g.171076  ORF Transcript_84351/g.171076 Transcript_84351/m.171076 type:complete len:108 (-) Transcript_84351:122-445(-)